jgi:hypothetical protein
MAALTLTIDRFLDLVGIDVVFPRAFGQAVVRRGRGIEVKHLAALPRPRALAAVTLTRAVSADRSHGSGNIRSSDGRGCHLRAQHFPCDIGAQVFASDLSLGSALDQGAVLGGHAPGRLFPLTDSALADSTEACQCRLRTK